MTSAINSQTIGTCGNCGGPVTVPMIWHGVNNPTPRCERCYATPRESFGPTIPMNPAPSRTAYSVPGSLFSSARQTTDMEKVKP